MSEILTFEATIILSLFSFIALPKLISERPYTGDVSKKLIPKSIAFFTQVIQAWSSSSPEV